MVTATEIRVGNVLRLDGKVVRVLSQEIRGTGKSGKTIHLRVKGLEDGNISEKSIRAEDKAENVDCEHVKMQFLYRDPGIFNFMNMSTYEQVAIPAAVVGRQEVFLKENLEIDVLMAEGRPVTIEFPRFAELKVTSTPPGTKSGGDSNYKEAELENGLKVLVPQFVREGETVRVNIEDLSYLERVSTKSL